MLREISIKRQVILLTCAVLTVTAVAALLASLTAPPPGNPVPQTVFSPNGHAFGTLQNPVTWVVGIPSVILLFIALVALSVRRDNRRQRRARKRFLSAVEMLNDADPSQNLTAVTLLSDLARDWPEGAQLCVDAMCARLRQPWQKDLTDSAESSEHSASSSHGSDAIVADHDRDEPDFDHSDEVSRDTVTEHQVRTAILTTIAGELRPYHRAALSVLRDRAGAVGRWLVHRTPQRYQYVAGHWSTMTLDLSGATLPYCDFSHCMMPKKVFFNRARFVGGADFSHAVFPNEAWFSGTLFGGDAIFDHVLAERDMIFYRSVFRGVASFIGTSVLGGIWFSKSAFQSHANFSGFHIGKDAGFGMTRFADQARFESSQIDGRALFGLVSFRTDVSFAHARFGRIAWFGMGWFGGDTTFTSSHFRTHVGFGGASMASTASFDHAFFGGNASFGGAPFDDDHDQGFVNFGVDPTFVGASFNRRSSQRIMDFLDEDQRHHVDMWLDMPGKANPGNRDQESNSPVVNDAPPPVPDPPTDGEPRFDDLAAA